MALTRFDEILAMTACAKKGVLAVAGAGKAAVIDAVLDATDAGVAGAILIGKKPEVIRELLRERGRNVSDFNIVKTAEGREPGETAVEIIREGSANILMKGTVETAELLRPVMKKENGLRTGRTISHVAIYQLPFYHKLMITSDGGICAYPDLNKKRDIILNAAGALYALGCEKPKAAVLCCKETVDEKMPETLDGRDLKEMSLRGELGDCIVEGPISFDLAMSRERAVMKHYDCPYSGDFDILVSPNIHAGNILGKSWEMLAGVEMASYVSGARIPIVLTSRAAPARERLLCIAIAGIIAAGSGECELKYNLN